MPLFRRRSSGDAQQPYAEFWGWWDTEGRALAERSIADRDASEAFADAIGERVSALGGLAWELAPGDVSAQVLVLGAGGDPALRALARRVVLAAPEPDEIWSYADAKPPVADPESVVVALGATDVDLARVRVTARMEAGRFDVQVHHPVFADLPADERARLTFLALDATLGENDTELWLGEVQPVEFAPIDGFGLSALRAVVQDLKRQRLDTDGQPQWLMLTGETPQGPLLAMVRSPLHPVTAPNLDTYVAVAVPYRDRTDGGLPGADALEALRAFEHRLAARLGNEGEVVAHLSTGGVRTLHLYVDSAADMLPTVKEVARSWDQGKVTVHDMHDPGWQAVAHLRQ